MMFEKFELFENDKLIISDFDKQKVYGQFEYLKSKNKRNKYLVMRTVVLSDIVRAYNMQKQTVNVNFDKWCDGLYD